jgi:para-aminobenzoate synthetase component 2
LGHQAIGVAYGATVSRAPELLHGKTSVVLHDSSGVLTDIPTPFTATRYHSLAIEEGTLPPEVIVTGRSESGVVMSIKHKSLPIHGVLTEYGYQMLGNWLVECGDTEGRKKSEGLSPVVGR